MLAGVKVWVAVLFLFLSATGFADVFKLPNGGRLELFPVGKWKVASEDVGELRIILIAADPRTNARAVYSVATEGSDDFPTEEKMHRQVWQVAERMLLAGEFVERKPTLKPFYPNQGFGFYALMTNRRLVGRSPAPGEFKFLSLGMIRLAPSVHLKVQIMADSEEAEPYQQLLGMAEGAVYTPR